MLEGNYIKRVLKEIGFEERFITEQTANCIVALHERNGELLRIHDVIEFMRNTLGKKVAENTRESIRKQSMKPLTAIGAVIVNADDPLRAINSGKWNYKLSDSFRSMLDATDNQARARLTEKWLAAGGTVVPTARDDIHKVRIRLPNDRKITLSPGNHNLLIKSIIEEFVPKYVPGPKVLYIGDALNKRLYVDEALAKRMGIIIDEHDKLPDVMVWSGERRALFVIEAVTSVGPVEEQRRKEIDYIINVKPLGKISRSGSKIIEIGFVTVFPNRKVFAKFSKVIAWGTDVWIANEPTGVIRYQHSGRTVYVEI